MKRLMTMLGIVGICSVAALSAQTPAAAPAPAHKAEHAAMKADKTAKAATMDSTVTGCVAAAADAKHYTLTGDDKTVYDLSGGTLKPHVGHKVEVTGATHKAAAAGGHEVLKVKSVKMVAPSC